MTLSICLPDMAVISQQAVPSTLRGCLTFPHHINQEKTFNKLL